MIKKLTLLAFVAVALLLNSGCANGPIRNLFQGAFCNSCQPPVGQPLGCGTNYAPACDACGTGVAVEGAPIGDVPVSAPFVESAAPYTAPQGNFYSEPTLSDQGFINDSYGAPIEAPGIGTIPSAEVYGSGIGNPISPPSIEPFQGSGSLN